METVTCGAWTQSRDDVDDVEAVRRGTAAARSRDSHDGATLMLIVDLGLGTDVPRPSWRSGRAWSPRRRLAGSGSPTFRSSTRSAVCALKLRDVVVARSARVRRAQPSGLSLLDVVSRLVRRLGTGWTRRGLGICGAPISGAPKAALHVVVRARRAITQRRHQLHVHARALDVDGVGRGSRAASPRAPRALPAQGGQGSADRIKETGSGPQAIQ